MTLAEAIARFEGFSVLNSVSQRNNNPGNLRAGPRAIAKDDRGYSIYATADDGWADLQRQIELDAGRGLTLQQFLNKYAPKADSNDPNHYANTVAQWLGISTDTPLSALQGTAPGPPVSGPPADPSHGPIRPPLKRS